MIDTDASNDELLKQRCNYLESENKRLRTEVNAYLKAIGYHAVKARFLKKRNVKLWLALQRAKAS